MAVVSLHGCVWIGVAVVAGPEGPREIVNEIEVLCPVTMKRGLPSINT
ncbi:MAG: hypothetical protein ACYCS7_17085 [Acidimicrobiales bacterium]